MTLRADRLGAQHRIERPRFRLPGEVLAGIGVTLLAAILSGGVFGDHCSPISDSTAVSSVASGCDLLEHVKTQLPYALFCGVLALLAFLAAGLMMI